MQDNFAVFILSHGRAGNIKTLKMLKKGNYTGKTYIIIDNQDEQGEEYKKLYGEENVIVFDKQYYKSISDYGDNGGNDSVVLWARNACHDIARGLGLKYFLELDDDYSSLDYRRIEGNKLAAYKAQNLDELFTCFIKWLDDSGAMVIALSQAGDFIGGAKSKRFSEKVLRKAMNAFFCDVDKRFQFYGRINEDCTMYTLLGRQGKLILSVTEAMIVQTITQKNKGGLTDIYLETGTYTKSFYSVMYSPSCVKVAAMGSKHKRVHHKINWNACAPKILSEKWRKRE